MTNPFGPWMRGGNDDYTHVLFDDPECDLRQRLRELHMLYRWWEMPVFDGERGAA